MKAVLRSFISLSHRILKHAMYNHILSTTKMTRSYKAPGETEDLTSYNSHWHSVDTLAASKAPLSAFRNTLQVSCFNNDIQNHF